MKKIMLGNEAVARGAYEGGCRIATGYPGTPSTEILETTGKLYQDHIYSQWSPNEKVALEVAAGSAIAGARAMAAMKHVGLNVAADPLFTFSYSGINAGLVIISADDPGALSSQNEQDNRHLARAAKVPMLDPSDPQEAKNFTKLAFELSAIFDRPVIIRMTTKTAHSRAVVECAERENSPLKAPDINPPKYVMIPLHAIPRHKIIEELNEKLAADACKRNLNKIEKGTSKRGIVTGGAAYHYVKEVCPGDSILKLGLAWPFTDHLIREFAEQVEELFVVEELDPFIEEHIRSLGIKVNGGKDIIPIFGELNQDIVNKALNNPVQEEAFPEYPNPLPGRPPSLCKGCPHSLVFQILKDLDVYVQGDIGCYTLGALPPHNAMHSQICMGASIGMHFGLELAHGRKYADKSVAVIGDSTFCHSGITPLIDLVYNGGTSTVIILDNRTTAMTGHQENPVTGKTLMGKIAPELDLIKLTKACGIKRVTSIDPVKKEELKELIIKEMAAEAPSVIIVKRKCILKR